MVENISFPFYCIALDIGGTKIAGGILLYEEPCKQPEIVFYDKVAARAKEGCDIFVSNICNFTNTLISKAKSFENNIEILGIGMGSAGRIRAKDGKVMTATDNFPGYEGCELCRTVSEKCGYKAFALNDVQSHTLGEQRWGAGKGVNNFVLLAVGTGIGGAVVADGKLLMGSHGYAGELGHIQACLAVDVTCTCGKSGHLEAVAAGCGIEFSYEKFSGKKMTGSEISELAKNGDKHAVAAIELAGRSLGQIIAQYLSIFDPEIIILSGSVSHSGKIWKDAVMKGFNEEVIPEISCNLQLCDAKLGDEAALIGASEYVLDRLGE